METISRSNQIKSALTSEKITESKIVQEYAINWLNTENVCFMCRTKVNVNDEWLYVGDADIQEYKNTEESLKLLKSNVPEPYLTAVLTVWEKSTSKNINKGEILS